MKLNCRRSVVEAGWGKKWLLVAGFSALLNQVNAQAPAQLIRQSGTYSIVGSTTGPVGADVPVNLVVQMEQRLATFAKSEAIIVAGLYARAPGPRLNGVRELGQQLLVELNKPGANFDFRGVVAHNPAFWEAEREFAPGDVSLPYLVSMLEIVAKDYVTAARTIAMTQATMPLTTTVRRGYSRPESMLLYLDSLLLTGIPEASRMQTPEQCEASITLLRQRIAHWSNRPGLLRALIELEVRRVELETKDGEHLELMDQRVAERLALTPADLEFARTNDPILATGFDATVRQWLNKVTLAQQWSRWIELGDPATLAEVEASVAAYAANGRPDLAWLSWRHTLVLQAIMPQAEIRRWKTWCAQLLDAKAAAYVEKATAENPLAGMATLPMEHEGFSEAWAGDQGINPLLAVKIERRIAMVDTMLSIQPVGSYGEGSYRLTRAGLLSDIDAVEPSRQELRRVRDIIHGSEKIGMLPDRVKIMDLIRSIECRLLDAEGHFVEAEDLYHTFLDNPALEGLKVNYVGHLFMAGDYPKTHEHSKAFALRHPEDTYRAITADLTARRFGQRETELLQTARKNIRAERWPADGVRYLLGELSEDELLASARQGTEYEVADHQCEAYFWLGEVALAENRKEDGIKWLSRCVAMGFVSNIEYKVAKAELRRLIPESEKKKTEPENSNGVIAT